MKKVFIYEKALKIYEILSYVLFYTSLVLITFNYYLDYLFVVLSFVIGLAPLVYTIAIREKQKYVYEKDEKMYLKKWIKYELKQNRRFYIISVVIVIIFMVSFSVYSYINLVDCQNNDLVSFINIGLKFTVLEILLLYSIYLCRKSQLVFRYISENKVTENGKIMPPRANTMVWNRFPSDIDHLKLESSVKNVYVLWYDIILIPLTFGLVVIASLNPKYFITAPWFLEFSYGMFLNSGIFFSIYVLWMIFTIRVYRDYKHMEKYNKNSESFVYLLINSALPFIIIFNIGLFGLKIITGYYFLSLSEYSIYYYELVFHLVVFVVSLLSTLILTFAQMREHIFVSAWICYLKKEAKEKGEEHAS